jgi:hypothetical protein
LVRVAYGSSLALALPSWNERTSKSKKVDRHWEPVCRVRLERRGDESKRSHVSWSPSSATAKSGAILFLCVGDHWACELSKRSPLSRSGGAPFLDPTRVGAGEGRPIPLQDPNDSSPIGPDGMETWSEGKVLGTEEHDQTRGEAYAVIF